MHTAEDLELCNQGPKENIRILVARNN